MDGFTINSKAVYVKMARKFKCNQNYPVWLENNHTIRADLSIDFEQSSRDLLVYSEIHQFNFLLPKGNSSFRTVSLIRNLTRFAQLDFRILNFITATNNAIKPLYKIQLFPGESAIFGGSKKPTLFGLFLNRLIYSNQLKNMKRDFVRCNKTA